MPDISEFPNELLLSHMTLTSLIASKGVCRQWRHLVPLADISPTRRALLELYLEVISSPYFAQSRSWRIANLQPFDHTAFLDTLLKQHNYIPDGVASSRCHRLRLARHSFDRMHGLYGR
jgi:hypothetical protein